MYGIIWSCSGHFRRIRENHHSFRFQLVKSKCIKYSLLIQPHKQQTQYSLLRFREDVIRYFLTNSDLPEPRMGCAIASCDNLIYIFGGKNEDKRLNDLWTFSLSDFKFKKMSDEGEVPAVRNGHTLTYF